MAALVSSMLGSYFNKSGPTVAESRAEFRSQRGSAVEEVVNHVLRPIVDDIFIPLVAPRPPAR